MTQYRTAFDISPVPVPTLDAVAPEPFDGIYGMPAFVTVGTPDLERSVVFWTDTLGFFVLFAVPGRLVHLRRWAFQDVLLVPAPPRTDRTTPASDGSAVTVSFACVLSEVEPILGRCRADDSCRVEGPTDTPWNSRDVTVSTPEGVRVVFTAAKPYDPASAEAGHLRDIGIVPLADDGDHATGGQDGAHASTS